MEDEEIVVNIRFMPDREDFGIFWRLYDLEQKFHAHESGNKKVIWGKTPKANRVCRFCKRDATSTAFNKKAHAIPALMGNNLLFSDYECDRCNEIFGQYENELGNFGGIWHTLSLVKGRGGIPKFKHGKNNFFVTGEGKEISIYIDDSDKSKKGRVVIGDGKLTIDSFSLPCVPLDVFKSFVKIAFTFMDPMNLEKYDKARRWLIGEIQNDAIEMHPCFLVFRAVGKQLIRTPMVLLMRKVKTEKRMPFTIPEHCLLVYYGIFIYQIYIPYHQDEEQEFKKNGDLRMIIQEDLCTEIPTKDPLGEAQITYLNMGSPSKVKSLLKRIELPFIT